MRGKLDGTRVDTSSNIRALDLVLSSNVGPQ